MQVHTARNESLLRQASMTIVYHNFGVNMLCRHFIYTTAGDIILRTV